MKKYKFTVFTPVYNRVSTIHRVFDSLCSQTFKDFEWIVIDDGSTDGINQRIEYYIENSTFPIIYKFQTNSGKHIAYNTALELTNGELFLTLDSDDEFLPNALNILNETWEGIPKENRFEYSAVSGLCIDQNGKLVGTKYPKDTFDSNSLETHYKYKVKGEKSGFQVTEILKKYKFPIENVGQCIGEGVVWNEISKKYKTRYINRNIRVYYIEEKPSLMKIIKSGKNAEGNLYYYRYKFNNEISFFRYAPHFFIYYGFMFSKQAIILKKNIFRELNLFNNKLGKFCVLITYPIALFSKWKFSK